MHQKMDYDVNDGDELLTKVVVDICGRTFRLYSNLGEERKITCETTQQFMDVLELVRAVVHSEIVAYSHSLTK